jgi:hypothetical protein
MAQDNTASLGTMLSFLGQGADAGDVSPAQVSMPQINLPSAKTEAPQQGGGLLKGVLGNLLSSYVGDKLQTHMDNAAAKEESKAMLPVVEEQLKAMPVGSPYATFLATTKRMIGSDNPTIVKAGLKAHGNFTDSLANNLATTAEEKNVANPAVMAMQTRKDNAGSIPSGMTRDAQGNLSYAPMATGGNYGDVVAQRALDQRSAMTPVQAQQLQLAQQANTRADEAAQRADAKDARDNKRYEQSLIKEINPTHRMAYTGNLSSINQIDKALEAVDKRPESFGLTMMGGDKINQRLDPEGTKYRAAISQIASAKRHDISGAAVSPTEDKYLQPFLPNETDTPDAIKKKLLTLREQYTNTNSEIGSIYKEGYRNVLPAIPKDPYTLKAEKQAQEVEKQAQDVQLSPEQEAAYQAYIKGGKK